LQYDYVTPKLQRDYVTYCLNITPAIKHVNCHAGLDPASSLILDSRFRGNDGFVIYCCRSNNNKQERRKYDS
ncbi:MAG: hypothetical protein U9N38_06170, partial [Thermodesulfobacteriota bacterium]|nr:hypothetical protein [Thermodesulfobacteriota bacterium]